jgi:UDP-2,3-diacylglucosamine pyrophosphatase LpxH
MGSDSLSDETPDRRFRTLFISDVHLGARGSQADRLLDFLRIHDADTIYLVGDIVDGWALKSNWYWPQSHNDFVQKLLRKARKGTSVIYIPGNHDAFGRHFAELSFGGIELRKEAIHRTADGRQLLVVHGDLFDGVIQCARWLAFVGDRMYMVALHLNRWLNVVRAQLGFSYWSLSQFLKHKVKNAVNYISDFEVALAQEARRRGVDGVVCGHIHKAEIRSIDGMLYCNDGDWVESLTALVESADGSVSILHWKEIVGQFDAALTIAIAEEMMTNAYSAGD